VFTINPSKVISLDIIGDSVYSEHAEL
jgi:hypothetical protein